MTIHDLVETMVFSRSYLFIVDKQENILICIHNGDESELSKYNELEVMEIYSKNNCVIAQVWL